jgi:pimeloyl-ACP methyl ester carboxylesterase
MRPFRQLAASCVAALAFALGGCAAPGTSPGGAEVRTETFMIPAADAGIQLHVRNKYAAGASRFAPAKVILFVHGATYPSETAFDLDLPGGSWMDIAARRGYDVYMLDVRGYGRSTRPPTMDAPPAANPPFADTADAVRDIGAAVEFIRKRRGVDKLNLVGWSWGTATMAGYAAANNDKVVKLVLYAPLWNLKAPPPISGSGAYRVVEANAARARGIRGIPPERVEEISPKAWFDKWWAGNLATDVKGAAQSPPVVRAPNGVIKDVVERWGQQKPTYDPAAIRVPTMLLVAEWDQDTPPYMAQELYTKLSNAPDRRLVMFNDGTHAIVLEKHRMKLIEAVQSFLQE